MLFLGTMKRLEAIHEIDLAVRVRRLPVRIVNGFDLGVVVEHIGDGVGVKIECKFLLRHWSFRSIFTPTPN